MIKKLTNHTKKVTSKVSSLHKKNPRFAPFFLLAIIFLVLLAIIIFQNKKLSQLTTRSPKGEQNVMTSAFTKAGITSCKERIEQVTNFLIAGNKSAATIFLSNKNQNENIASISMEISNKNGDFAYSSASFSPSEDECSAVYEAVKYWNSSCAEVSQKLGLTKEAPKMLKDIKIINLNNNTKIFLMPAQEGCVSIKKEIIF